MCCCTGNVSAEAPEYGKRFKSENNTGCGCGGGSSSCDTPSRARSGSALWEWEQTYGKVISQITKELGEDGRWKLVHVKTTCPEESTRSSRKSCCSLRYRVIR